MVLQQRGKCVCSQSRARYSSVPDRHHKAPLSYPCYRRSLEHVDPPERHQHGLPCREVQRAAHAEPNRGEDVLDQPQQAASGHCHRQMEQQQAEGRQH